MRKSCLTQIILLVVIIFVLGMAVRQAIRRGGHAVTAPNVTMEATPTQSQSAAAAVVEGAVVAVQPSATPAAPATPAAALELVSSRPVMLAEAYPVGLAADGGWLYVAGQREPGPGVLVARVALADYSVAAQRDLSRAGEHRLGGIAAIGDSVWVALQDSTVSDASLLLELDANTLDTRRNLAVGVALTAVAAAPDGALYASRCAPGELLRLTDTGEVVQRVPSLEGACYRDLSYITGALVGVAAGANVLDVYDSATLTLLARHTLPFSSAQGNPVAGNALAYDGAQFLFAPDRVVNPIIMAYQPRGGALGAVIPAALPAAAP